MFTRNLFGRGTLLYFPNKLEQNYSHFQANGYQDHDQWEKLI